MSDPIDQSQAQKPEAPGLAGRPHQDKRALRWKTAKFVLVFVVSVFVLLVGYDLAKATAANDWYLFQVARSTVWLLHYVGYSSTLGDGERFSGKEAETRAMVEAWRRGEEPPNTPPPSTDTSPMTPWEAWQCRAMIERRPLVTAQKELEKLCADTSLAEPERGQKIDAVKSRIRRQKDREMGPLVCFMLKPGLVRQLADAKADLARVEADPALDEEARAQRAADLKATIAQLEEEVKNSETATPRDPGAGKEQSFNFILIPDCGAVQSMAIFLSAILAFPARWWKRVAGIVVGLPVLFWVNSFRLAFLAVIGAWDNGGPRFRFAHEYIWQGIYIVFVVALWMGWVEFLVRRRS
jgi:exosortase/archaeosortase family protein